MCVGARAFDAAPSPNVQVTVKISQDVCDCRWNRTGDCAGIDATTFAAQAKPHEAVQTDGSMCTSKLFESVVPPWPDARMKYVWIGPDVIGAISVKAVVAVLPICTSSRKTR